MPGVRKDGSYIGRSLSVARCEAALRRVANRSSNNMNIWFVSGNKCGNKTWGMLDFLKRQKPELVYVIKEPKNE